MSKKHQSTKTHKNNINIQLDITIPENQKFYKSNTQEESTIVPKKESKSNHQKEFKIVPQKESKTIPQKESKTLPQKESKIIPQKESKIISKIVSQGEISTKNSYANISSNSNPQTESSGIDNFIKYVNKSVKRANKYYVSEDPNVIEKNNSYLYFLAKTGIKCMDKPSLE